MISSAQHVQIIYYTVWALLITSNNARAASKEQTQKEIKPMEDMAHTSTTATAEDATTEIEPWMEKAVLDVAYFLRRHKFNGKDLRYRNTTETTTMFYQHFPDPPLNNVHWQVRKHCETSFGGCLKYLSEVLNKASLTREKNPFTSEKLKGKGQERAERNKYCLKMLQEDDTATEGFRNAMERFQWYVSASYFMCWYTYLRHEALRRFSERCDDYASCLSKDGSFENGDIRADPEFPFACAHYSFCPDPCCPNRLLTKVEDCVETPCGAGSPCLVEPSENLDWDSMLLNEWNVTCTCPRSGTSWSSQSGICVDIDECYEGTATCDEVRENCMNLAGTYECTCSFGFQKLQDSGPCLRDDFLMATIFNPGNKDEEETDLSWTEKYKSWLNKIKS